MTPLCADIEHAIDSVSALLQERQLTLHRDGFSNDLQAWLDSSRAQQVVINLLSNAIKFSPQGSSLWMSMQCTEQYLRLSLRDSGPGIPADFQQQIFEPFTQADMSNTRDGNSTGLGLAFSRQLMHLMGGELSFSSPAGQGATFHADFLLQAPKKPATQVTPV
jgi:signal transduction histidine kinase